MSLLHYFKSMDLQMKYVININANLNTRVLLKYLGVRVKKLLLYGRKSGVNAHCTDDGKE